MKSLVLASASARRRAFLEDLGVPFETRPADVEESPLPGEAPAAMALRLARSKALAARVPGRWTLAADTVVAADEVILGKPVDREDARRMLRLLSGRRHRVVTGVVLLSPEGDPSLAETVETTVAFRGLGERDIDSYLATGEADDKAGAYGIQGAAAAFVTEVLGSHSNVVGLPLEVVVPALRQAGFEVANTP
jgi:septum formation protein